MSFKTEGSGYDMWGKSHIYPSEPRCHLLQGPLLVYLLAQQEISLATKQLLFFECRRYRYRAKVWATRFLYLLDQAKDITVHSEPYDSAPLVGAFRLARAVNIEDPDILQIISGFNYTVVTYIRYKLCNSRITKVCYSPTQCGLSTSLTNEFCTEWLPKGSLFSHDDPIGCGTKRV
ncbi:hypothetical protein PROQFM164_S02g002984 [Penicillium roqueforti FM164]|uniref:Uncharacterized protein n=1 Tax=Penicillium roqueforti (strain FM164) TaxID=1365484 RepID=W6Q800_PENRF|nr:hypothetical protein PROQFM164_S02g002984 [Penicillium roqueforti FM164]